MLRAFLSGSMAGRSRGGINVFGTVPIEPAPSVITASPGRTIVNNVGTTSFSAFTT